MSITKASWDTRHFSFTAYGNSPSHAVRTLRSLWHRHCEQAAADTAYFDECLDSGDIETAPLEIGAGYRDGERLV